MEYKIGIWLILSCLSAILYRMGGSGKPYNTKCRDVGVPLCVAICVVLLGEWHWSSLNSADLMFGAMTQYWKNGEPDVKWYHWFVTGLMYAVAWLPYCYYTHNMNGFAIYAIIISIGTVLWSEVNDNDVWEESGRGFLVTFFAPLLASGDMINLLTRGVVIQ